MTLPRPDRVRRSMLSLFAAGALLFPLVTGMTFADAATPEKPAPLLDTSTMVSYYGSPHSTGMGVLGTFSSPDAAAESLSGETGLVDTMNGDRGAFGAMDVIYGMVSGDAGPAGIYVRYLDAPTTEGYIDSATAHGQHVFLDMQIGRGNVAEEVRKLEPYLLRANVHVAIDPEYAVPADGFPIQTPGHISGDDINEAQAYLSQLVADNKLPPKMLLVHQYIDNTIGETERISTASGVTLVLDMDGIGSPEAKAAAYQKFTGQPWVQKKAYMVFLQADSAVSSEPELLAMNPAPDALMFQ